MRHNGPANPHTPALRHLAGGHGKAGKGNVTSIEQGICRLPDLDYFEQLDSFNHANYLERPDRFDRSDSSDQTHHCHRAGCSNHCARSNHINGRDSCNSSRVSILVR